MVNSKIEWCHDTGNLWEGCTEVHTGCDNCYARVMSNRFHKAMPLWGKDAPRMKRKHAFTQFLTLQAKAEAAGEVRRVFVGSMMDIFEKPMPVIDHHHNPKGYFTDFLRNHFFEKIIPACPNLIFLLLTKRPSNINKYIPRSWRKKAPDNVMFGATIVDQKTTNQVTKHMSKVVGRKFLSVEPLLEEIYPLVCVNRDPREYKSLFEGIDWIIVGGESGNKKRYFDAHWARVIRDHCEAFSIPFFMKQMNKIDPIPDDLMIREFPEYHNSILQ